jgi:hypothetical protein
VFRQLGSLNASTHIFKSEREAALSVDHYLIRHGKDPVNILKRIAV